MSRFLRSALFPLIVVVMIVYVISQVACGGSGAGAGCMGTVTDKFTEYEPGVGINSGGVTIPTGSTKYALAIKKSDGSFCSRRLKKQDWLAVQVGDEFGGA